MNAYEQIIMTIREQGAVRNLPPMQIAEMKDDKTCVIDTLELDADDLLVAEHLVTGYHKAVNGMYPAQKNDDTFVKPLKKGDIVLVQKLPPSDSNARIDEETYIIIERLVEL